MRPIRVRYTIRRTIAVVAIPLVIAAFLAERRVRFGHEKLDHFGKLIWYDTLYREGSVAELAGAFPDLGIRGPGDVLAIAKARSQADLLARYHLNRTADFDHASRNPWLPKPISLPLTSTLTSAVREQHE